MADTKSSSVPRNHQSSTTATTSSPSANLANLTGSAQAFNPSAYISNPIHTPSHGHHYAPASSSSLARQPNGTGSGMGRGHRTPSASGTRGTRGSPHTRGAHSRTSGSNRAPQDTMGLTTPATGTRNGVHETTGTTAAAGSVNAISVGAANQSKRSAGDIFRETKSLAAESTQTLRAVEPWDRGLETKRQSLRTLHTTLICAHPTSPYSQSLDHLWIATSHIFISAYRAHIARIEKLLTHPTGTPAAKLQQKQTGPVEHRKVVTRFKQFLSSEMSFYRKIINTVVQRADLVEELADLLKLNGIPLDPEQEASTWRLTHDERSKKIAIVHKAVICLGDLERYKEQYGVESDRKKPDGKKAKKREGKSDEDVERYAKAKRMYETARSIIPDNGNPSNQLAVVAMNVGDHFCAVYHYYRALTVRQPFATAETNLSRLLEKVLKDYDGGSDFRYEEVVVHAMLKADQDSPLIDNQLARFKTALQARDLPSEVIVKTIVIAISAEWQARMHSMDPAHHLAYLLGLATSLLQTVTEILSESVVEETDLSIPAVLRRILPTLRIFSKWLKVNLEIVPNAFWSTYHSAVTALSESFPLDRLPQLTYPLEEDLDMQGFRPIRSGMCCSSYEPAHDSHPNEEQLMRISDILVDSRLLISRGDDMASVSTETEDDPVNMAMRATLNDGSSVGDAQSSQDEEELVWQPNQQLRELSVVDPMIEGFVKDSAPFHAPRDVPVPAPSQQPDLLFGGTLHNPTSRSSIWSTANGDGFAPVGWKSGVANDADEYLSSTPRLGDSGVIGQLPRPG